MPKKKLTPEKAIQNTILDWLRLQPECFAWQNDTRPVYDPTKGCFRALGKYAMRGASDIIGMWGNRFLAIEVKAGKNTMTQEQRLFLLEINRRGGIGFVAHSLDQVIAALKPQ